MAKDAWILLFLSLVIALPNGKGEQGPIVSTTCGEFQGKFIDTPRGQCHAYMGIPFASPPVGDLRWKKPKPPPCWTGVKNATTHGPMCVQVISINETFDQYQSEDCLYLNVILPSSAATNSSAKLPVMVFIHGGAFILGSSAEYGDEGPCENLATRGVIIVTIQYRLGLYGFFASGDNAALGNYGIWDQIEALKWVSKNIESFGGDPNMVTIFGESAGGASVSYLTYIDVAKDLFHQSISQSGSAWTYWALPRDFTVPASKQIAVAANCSNPDANATISCLRGLSTKKLQEISKSLFKGTILTSSAITWGIRVDGELFNQSVGEMFTQSKSNWTELINEKPAIIGVNSAETPIANNKTMNQSKDQFDQTLGGAFNGSDKRINEVLKQMAYYAYVDSQGDRNDEIFMTQQFSKMLADLSFHAPAAQEATSKAATGRPVWVYNFDFWSDNVFEPGYPFEKGAPHAHELCYLFLLHLDSITEYKMFCPKEYTGKYKEIADHLGEMWTNFAKRGDPSSKDINWPKFQNITDASAMTFRSNLSIEHHFYLHGVSFWNELVPAIEKE